MAPPLTTRQHPSAPPRTWGAAYRIPARHVDEVRRYLDIREINGYTVDFAAFHVPPRVAASMDSAATQPIKALVYIGQPTNPQFVGPQDMDVLAEHVARSSGPSGQNCEYVYELAAALEQIRREADVDVEVDEHVADLARRVRAVLARAQKPSEGVAVTTAS